MVAIFTGILQRLYTCHDLRGFEKAQENREGERKDLNTDHKRLGDLESFWGRLFWLVISCNVL